MRQKRVLQQTKWFPYYKKFASGGIGLIITEGTYPEQKYSHGYFNQPGLTDEEQVNAWKKVTEAVHQEGSKIIVQLMHAGALSQGNRFTTETLGPSQVRPRGTNGVLWRKWTI